MSDSAGSPTPLTAGWWKADDGLFYPPQLHPNYASLQAEASVGTVDTDHSFNWRDLIAPVAGGLAIAGVIALYVAAQVSGTGRATSADFVKALFYAVLNIGAMIYCAFIGREKGYSPIAFAALGFCCSLLGVLIARKIPPR